MSYIGSWKIDDLLTFTVNTHNASTGAATDADAVPAYRVYEDETATPILTGTMALLDSTNTTGFYSEQITLSTANGFEKGKSYNIYISAAVSSVTGTTTRSFQMEAEVSITNTAIDAIFKRDLSSVTGEAARSLLNALRPLRNKVTRVGTTLTVYKEDDTTSAWTGTLTTSSSVDLITEIDPA